VDLSFEGGGSASSISGGVGVVALENLSVFLNVVHTVSLPSSIASMALLVAINELLFGEGDQFSGLDGVVTFHSAGG